MDGATPETAAAIGPEGRFFAALGAFLFAPPRAPAAVLAALLVAAGLLVLLRRGVLRSRPAGKRLFRLAGRFEMGVLALLLLAMVVLSTLQIVLRNLFGIGLLWVDPLLRYATLWIGFLGAAVAAAEGRHIQIDVLTHILPAGVKRITITHPHADFLHYTLEQMIELGSLGALLEFHYAFATKMLRNPMPVAELAKSIRKIGPERCILATDGGQAGNPPPHEMLRLFIAGMLGAGFSDDEIQTMTIRNPGWILGLE